ncbi:MAG TPA: bifunctional nicotinamidase/pyrazinamidase [Aliidongia sp.]|nr:bifunctional nicotinamidase/pyrazinamidase [Aliidongia sp.]
MIDRRTDILGLIDIQPTFMPGGELAVAEGDAVVPVANRLLRERFDHAFATQDWHPAGHGSFASAHPGRAPFETIRLAYGDQTLWPDHGLQGSPGAVLHPGLDPAKIELIVRKGFRTGIDSYSAFFENDRTTPTGLAGYLRDRGFARIFFAGLATDFCVAYSAEDAVRLGFRAFVVEDACRGIGMALAGGGNTMTVAKVRLERLGVRFVPSGLLQG